MEKLLTAIVVITFILPVPALPQVQECLEAERKKCFLDRDEKKCKNETSLRTRLKFSTTDTRRVPSTKTQQPLTRNSTITGIPSRPRDIVRGKVRKTFRTEINLPFINQSNTTATASFVDVPFISDPSLIELPVGTRVEVFGHGRGERPLRIVIKESNYDEAGRYTDVAPIKIFEDRDIRPQSPKVPFTTTRPWILYEIQQLSAAGEWEAILLPDRYEFPVSRGASGIPRGVLLVQPIIPGAQDEPVLVVTWGGLPSRARYIQGEKTVTVLGKDIFDILLRGVQSRTSDEIIAEFKKCRNRGPFEDIEDVKTNLHYEIVDNNRIRFKYRWDIEDFLDQPWPLGGCDCDIVGVDVDLYWRIDERGNVGIRRAPIGATDLYLRCPSCPAHVYAAGLGLIINTFPFRYVLDEQEFYGFGEMKRAIEQNVQLVLQTGLGNVPVNATVIGSARASVKRLWIEEGALKATIQYVINYRT
jgi:hypothetical protein